MAERRYWWLKLQEDFFKQKAMKKLRRMENGSTYTIIYLKMQLASLRNNGMLVFEHMEDSFANELAYEIDEAPEDVAATIDFLLRYGLLVPLSKDESYIPAAVENSGSEGSSAKRMRALRERGTSQCDGSASLCYGEKEKELEKEIEIELELERGADKPPAHTRFVPPTVEEVAEYVRERRSKVDPQGFINYYAARGWMMGKYPMTDWKAACRNAESWERWDKPGKKAKTFTQQTAPGGEKERLQKIYDSLKKE